MGSLIISPHLDDAILSLGGYLEKRKNNKDTVFTLCNTAWTALDDKLTVDEITKMNLDEELRVIKDIGCEHKFSNFDEALLRNYTNWNDPFDLEGDKEVFEEIKDKIKKEICRRQYECVFVPLAIGEHVDHILVYKIAQNLQDYIRKRGTRLCFYEDLSYATYGGSVDRLEKANKDYKLQLLKIEITDVFEKKCEYLKTYKSQLTDEDIYRIRKYIADVDGAGTVNERVWMSYE